MRIFRTTQYIIREDLVLSPAVFPCEAHVAQRAILDEIQLSLVDKAFYKLTYISRRANVPQAVRYNLRKNVIKSAGDI